MSEPTPVHKFFSAVSEGDIERLLSTVHESAEFCAPGPDTVPIYNTFYGKEGVREFVRILGELFQTEAFEIYNIIESGEQVFATGLMKHRVRKTGKMFECEWALVCRIKDEKIISYKMFEDTAALEKAYTED